jgi:hypothetical protein
MTMSPWHKRVPHNMVSEYTSKGWKVWRVDETYTLLVWPDDSGVPE